MKHSRILNIFVCVLIVLAVPLAVFAIKTGNPAKSAAGTYERKTTDRIDITVDHTEFELEQVFPGQTTFTVSFDFSVRKTQADFYAVINSFDIDGIEYDSLVFTPLNENCDGATLSDQVLPAVNGEPVELSWKADLTFSLTDADIYTPNIVLNYTSGMTSLTCDTHELEIPLLITVSR